MTVAIAQTPILLLPADPNLITKMQNAKGVPRFICAPKNTGRSTLAMSFARQSFKLDEILWFDGASFGFAEAISTNKIFEHISCQVSGALSCLKLIVFDDLPFLSERSSRMFSDWIDEMIDAGIDIVVVTTPWEDSLKNYQSDRFNISGELLVSHGRWSKSRQLETLKSFFASDIPLEMRSLAALMILMQRGVVDNLRSLGYTIKESLHCELKQLCPLIEIDEATGFFDSSSLLTHEIKEQLFSCLRQAQGTFFGEANGQSSDEECCFERLTQLSSYLLERGDRKQSLSILELAGSILTHDDAGFPLKNKDCGDIDDSYSYEGNCDVESKGDVEENIEETPMTSIKDVEQKNVSSKEGKKELIGDVSPITVRLFGDFEVIKEGRRLDAKDLKRQKVRILLTHLILNMGKGISRDLLLEQMWPDKDHLHAKDNFYATWSKLAHILSGGSKNCPYLISNRGICKIDSVLVRSDVGEFEELARAILFQKGSVDDRAKAIDCAEQLYRGDILSGCQINGSIGAAQHKYRSLHVDVMLEASRLFSEKGNDANAVWFARKAFDSDSCREDVYRILMSVQDKAGQRTSALQTYFDCKRFLSEELGILPSQKTIDLYQELILDRR